MLNVYDLEMTIQSRAREVEEGLREESLVHSATQSMSAGVKPMPRMNGLRVRVGTRLMELGAGLSGLSSRGQYIEDCQCYGRPATLGQSA